MTREADVLAKIIDYCDDITALVNRFGDSLETFENDFAYQYACSMCIIQIGELAARLSDEFQDIHADVPWREIKAMRNIFAHSYEKFSPAKTWNVITGDIPVLSAQCADILSA